MTRSRENSGLAIIGLVSGILVIIGYLSPWIVMDGVLPGVPKEAINIVSYTSGLDITLGRIFLEINILGKTAYGGIEMGEMIFLSLILASAILVSIGAVHQLLGKKEYSLYLLIGGLITIILTAMIIVFVPGGEEAFQIDSFTITSYITHGYGLYLALLGGTMSLGTSIYQSIQSYKTIRKRKPSIARRRILRLTGILLIILIIIPSTTPYLKTGALPSPWKEIDRLLDPLWNIPVVNAVTGHGGLTVGIREDGVVTNLNWPSPSYHDHINYYNDGDLEKLFNKGLFIGLYLDIGGTKKVSWVKEPEWKASQRYMDIESTNIVTELYHPQWGIRIRIIDSVHPEYDIFSRRVFLLDEGEARDIQVIFYNNFAPATYHLPRLPSVTDALVDEYGDFATIYLEERGLMLHFKPNTLDNAREKLRDLLGKAGEVEIGELGDTLGEGVYIAVGLSKEVSMYQVGYEVKTSNQEVLSGEAAYLDPYIDIEDGVLSGNRWAIGQTVEAMMTPLIDEVSMYIAVGETPMEAVKLEGIARDIGSRGIEAASDNAWRELLGEVEWFPFYSERAEAIAKRTLLLLFTCRDRRTGAIVAAPSTQSPYRQDWLRDGFFFDIFLDELGLHRYVTQRNLWLASVQREDGTWDSFYYADGVEAGFIWSFQLDSNGFAVASLWLHYEYTGNKSYLEKVYPAIKKGVEFLYTWRDPETGLPKPAYIDDTWEYSQDIQGAVALYLALDAGVKAAETLGVDGDKASLWRGRLDELGNVIREKYVETGAYGEQYPANRGGAYLIFLTDIVPDDDPGIRNTLRVFEDKLRDIMDKEVESFLYPQEPLLALIYGGDLSDPDYRGRILGYVDWLIYELPKEDTLHYGEAIFVEDGGYVHRTGYPHLWSAVETTLILKSLYNPIRAFK